MSNKISNCRICGSNNLKSLFNMGNLAHAGIFNQSGIVSKDIIEVVVCSESEGCGLVQLAHEFDPNVMYGSHYGYRSGLNQMMVDHLKTVATSVKLHRNNKSPRNLVVLDIGSNDGTLLKHFNEIYGQGVKLIGIDPSSNKFAKFYLEQVIRSNDFFSAETFLKLSNGACADIITSIAMFYDLPEPQSTVNEIASILAEDGLWVVEQSYLPLMLSSNSFDTICHEHTEYYMTKQFEWMCDRAGLCIVDMELNQANGGSFRLYIKKKKEDNHKSDKLIQYLNIEKLISNDMIHQFSNFKNRIDINKAKLFEYITELKNNGNEICGLGASTKGNILLQFYQLDYKDIAAVAEVNDDKFGMRTPDTKIQIIDQDSAIEKYNYFLVLPWHFRENFLKNRKFQGKTLIFPLPEFEVIEI